MSLESRVLKPPVPIESSVINISTVGAPEARPNRSAYVVLAVLRIRNRHFSFTRWIKKNMQIQIQIFFLTKVANKSFVHLINLFNRFLFTCLYQKQGLTKKLSEIFSIVLLVTRLAMLACHWSIWYKPHLGRICWHQQWASCRTRRWGPRPQGPYSFYPCSTPNSTHKDR